MKYKEKRCSYFFWNLSFYVLCKFINMTLHCIIIQWHFLQLSWLLVPSTIFKAVNKHSYTSLSLHVGFVCFSDKQWHLVRQFRQSGCVLTKSTCNVQLHVFQVTMFGCQKLFWIFLTPLVYVQMLLQTPLLITAWHKMHWERLIPFLRELVKPNSIHSSLHKDDQNVIIIGRRRGLAGYSTVQGTFMREGRWGTANTALWHKLYTLLSSSLL